LDIHQLSLLADHHPSTSPLYQPTRPVTGSPPTLPHIFRLAAQLSKRPSRRVSVSRRPQPLMSRGHSSFPSFCRPRARVPATPDPVFAPPFLGVALTPRLTPTFISSRGHPQANPQTLPPPELVCHAAETVASVTAVDPSRRRLSVVGFILHLHNPAAAQTDVLRISLENSMSYWRSLLQSAACGGRPCLSFRC
jgi:hypothetical protein